MTDVDDLQADLEAFGDRLDDLETQARNNPVAINKLQEQPTGFKRELDYLHTTDPQARSDGGTTE